MTGTVPLKGKINHFRLIGEGTSSNLINNFFFSFVKGRTRKGILAAS